MGDAEYMCIRLRLQPGEPTTAKNLLPMLLFRGKKNDPNQSVMPVKNTYLWKITSKFQLIIIVVDV